MFVPLKTRVSKYLQVHIPLTFCSTDSHYVNTGILQINKVNGLSVYRWSRKSEVSAGHQRPFCRDLEVIRTSWSINIKKASRQAIQQYSFLQFTNHVYKINVLSKESNTAQYFIVLPLAFSSPNHSVLLSELSTGVTGGAVHLLESGMNTSQRV